MAKHFAVGIDIGTDNIRIGLAESLMEGDTIMPKMAAFGLSQSKGLRHGYIVEKEEAINALKKAKRVAEKNSGMRISRGFISVSGTGLGSHTTSGDVIVSRGDLEVTELDIEKLTTICEENIPSQVALNRRILHTIPLSFKLDGKPVVGSPIGMKGAKLEMKCLFINALEKHIKNLVEVVEDAGIEVSDLVASPIASALVLLSKQQRRVGCALVNIGSETVSIVVYENDIPISLEVIQTGSSYITNDIALGLKISLEEAEHVKLGGLSSNSFSQKKLNEIIEARLSDIFDGIETHFKKINRNGLLPAGIIFYGGGSLIGSIDELAKEYLKLPAKVGAIPGNNGKDSIIKDASWASVYGLCLLGLDSKNEDAQVKELVRKGGYKIKRFLKQFLP